MLVANIVVETLPGKARAVVERMSSIKGMGALSAENDHRVLATWIVPECDNADGLSEVLQAMNPEILQVHPTLVTED